MMMKTSALVAFLAFAFIFATFQDQAEASDLMKNRRLLTSDWYKTFIVDPRRKMGEANNEDDEDSTPENNTHHLLPNQNYKPPN